MDYLKLVWVNVIPERFKTDGYDGDNNNNNSSNNNNINNNNNNNNNNVNILRMLNSYTQKSCIP